MEQNYFKRMQQIPTRSMFEKKGNLDYLPWSIAWQLLKQEYSTANYGVKKNKRDNLNYFTDGKTCWVEVWVDAFGVKHSIMLAVMDNRNNSIVLEKLTSTDVQNTIMRALVKAIALHGIGLNAWTGEQDQKQIMQKKQFEEFIKVAQKKDVAIAHASFDFTDEQKSIIKNKFK